MISICTLISGCISFYSFFATQSTLSPPSSTCTFYVLFIYTYAYLIRGKNYYIPKEFVKFNRIIVSFVWFFFLFIYCRYSLPYFSLYRSPFLTESYFFFLFGMKWEGGAAHHSIEINQWFTPTEYLSNL